MAHDVFISYSTRDKAIADATCHALEGRQIRCWYAPRDISSGAIWAEAIVDAIGASRVFVLLFSEGSNRSQQVLREVSEAVSRGIPIIPMRVEDVVPTKAMAYYLSTIQWLDALTPEMDRHLERLGRRVEALLRVEDLPAPVRDVAAAPAAAPEGVTTHIVLGPGEAATTIVTRPDSAPAAAGAAQPRSRSRPRRLVLGLIAAAVLLLAGGLGWALSRGDGKGVPAEPSATHPPGTTEAAAVASPGSRTEGAGVTQPAGPSGGATPDSGTSLPPAATPAPLATGRPTSFPTPLTLAGTPLPEPAAALSPANAAQVGPLARWGRGGAYDVAYSSGGRLLVVAGSVGIGIYDAATLDPLREIESPVRLLRVALSPDGETVAACGDGDRVYLWRTGDGAPLVSLKMDTTELYGLAFSPDGRLLAVGTGSRAVTLWRLDDRSVLRELACDGPAWDLSFSPDGQNLAVATAWGDTAHLLQVSDGALLHSLEGHAGSVWGVAFAPDGQRLATACDDKQVRLWRASDGALLGKLEGHDTPVQSVVFSADGTRLATADSALNVTIWQVGDGALLRSLEAPYDPGSSLALAFAPAGDQLLIASRAHVLLWPLDTQGTAREVEGYAGYIEAMALDPMGQVLAVAANGEPVQIWSARQGTGLLEIEDQAHSLAFSPSGERLAAGGTQSLSLWSLAGERLAEAKEYTGDVTSIAFDGTGSLLASGTYDRTVRLWRAGDLGLLQVLEGHAGWVEGVAVSPDGAIVASAPREDSVRLWNATDGSLLRTLQGPERTVYNCVAFSPDGGMVAAGLNDETVLLWQVSDGALLREWHKLGGAVTSVAFSPDGSLLAAGVFDYTIRLLDVAGGEVARLVGHTYPVQAVAFSQDGKLLYSAGEDGTVRVWGVP